MKFTPYEPKLTELRDGLDASAQSRIAHALEYIADQVGVIAEKMTEMESHLSEIKTDAALFADVAITKQPD